MKVFEKLYSLKEKYLLAVLRTQSQNFVFSIVKVLRSARHRRTFPPTNKRGQLWTEWTSKNMEQDSLFEIQEDGSYKFLAIPLPEETSSDAVEDFVTDYEKISCFFNLYAAHLDLRNGKRKKAECIRFELNLAENLTTMHQQLRDKTYKMKGYYHFQVYEPKTRDVFAAFYQDRVLLNCICTHVVRPLIQKHVVYDNVACQTGKGTHFGIRRVTKFLSKHYKVHGTKGYVLKCDIRKYFASIDHEILKKKLDKMIVDADVRGLLYNFIDNHETEGRPGVGLPLGNQSSQWFAIYYLDPIDRFIKEQLRVKHYIRYMDDLLLIHHDKKFLQDALVQIEEKLKDELNLTLNSKTQIAPLKNGIEFIGWRFYISDSGKIVRKLKRQSKLRYKRRLKRLQKEYASWAIDWEDAQSTLASYKGHLKHGHAFKLKSQIMSEFALIRDPALQPSHSPCGDEQQHEDQTETSNNSNPDLRF